MRSLRSGLRIAFEEFATTRVLLSVNLATREAPVEDPASLQVLATWMIDMVIVMGTVGMMRR